MSNTRTQPTKAAALEELRLKIQRLEGFKSETGGNSLRLGIREVDGHLPGGALARGAIHEFISDSPETGAATTGFLAILLSRVAESAGTIVWIAKTKTIYAPGLLPYGLQPERIIFAEALRDRDALWAMEEALRCKSLSAVAGDIGDADLTATRRLQLAAESSGVTGFLLRHTPKKHHNSACITRWQVKPAPGVIQNGLPGVGAESWHVTLDRARGGRPGEWQVMWNGHSLEAVASRREEEQFLKAAGAR